MPLASATENKAIYTDLHDRIIEKRFQAQSPIRRYAHHTQYDAFIELIPPGSTVVDAGCGEGVLSVLLAKHGCIVTGIDLSEPNVAAAKKYAEEQGVADRTTFLVGDAENLPVADKSFDYAVSSHVLEHLPDFQKGAAELSRIAAKRVIVAIPTCLNPAATVLLGQDKYWSFSRRTPYAFFVGLWRIISHFVRGEEGVNEGYAGRSDLIHIWRFPWRGKERLNRANMRVINYRGSSYIFPYFPFLIPASKFLLTMRWWPVIRNLGYGTTYVCEPLNAVK
ncbi:MAG TPA: class I SAM-dependent methyltransferase [Candidatus Peribacteraceae bacterium]|nr:class I SAM-dependent methyltransferase [Candidatus Peribacteraceae bacterium]